MAPAGCGDRIGHRALRSSENHSNTKARAGGSAGLRGPGGGGADRPGRRRRPQRPAAPASGAPARSAPRALGVASVASRAGEAGPCISRITWLRRPLSSRISPSSRSTSGFRAPAGRPGGAGGAQPAGAAPRPLPCATRSAAEVALETDGTDGTGVDSGGFRKETGLFPGATGAACGPRAVVGESGGDPVGVQGSGRSPGRARPRRAAGGAPGAGRGGAYRAPGAAAGRCASARCGRRWPPRTSGPAARRPRARGRGTRRPSRSGARGGCACRRRTAAAARASAGAGASRSAGPRRPPPRGPRRSARARGTALRERAGSGTPPGPRARSPAGAPRGRLARQGTKRGWEERLLKGGNGPAGEGTSGSAPRLEGRRRARRARRHSDPRPCPRPLRGSPLRVGMRARHRLRVRRLHREAGEESARGLAAARPWPLRPLPGAQPGAPRPPAHPGPALAYLAR